MPAEKQRWSLVELQAEVEAIDQEKREITVIDPDGNRVTMTAGDQVERFDEIEVGDSIGAAYWSFVRAEFREPTAEEIETPLVVVAEGEIAPAEVDPMAAVGTVVKAVVEVVAINKEERQVAIQGPQGNYMILPVIDDAVLNNLTIGQVVIMTFAEAKAISLIKTP